MDSVESTKRQPWKAYEALFRFTIMAEERQIRYENVPDKKLVIPGSAGELNMSIEYDTGNKRPL